MNFCDIFYNTSIFGECAVARSAFARSDLYHLPEGIVSFARRDCIVCPKQTVSFARRNGKMYRLPEGVVSFARRNLYHLPNRIYRIARYTVKSSFLKIRGYSKAQK